ncbi:unnamed protein product [Arctia plantaginis]|uniref:Uncharacterized protein n=1 Tax=Arctia plantaginis TaxID=874455 RepID=A0A8S0ZG58_ARCPL|nr:unnamed protein product [Arctia plantaginis]
MVSYCCVKGCSNNSNHKKKDPNSLISFHAFPCNQELKTKWLKAIGRPNWVPPSHARICSTHFNHDQMNYEGCRIRIKDDAVPVNCLPVNSNFEATNVEACRICLATDLKLYSLGDNKLSTCLETVIGFNENYNIEGLPQYVCYQCAACLINYNKLVEKSMVAQATLLDIFAKNGQISQSLIKQQNRNKLNLNSPLNVYTVKDYYYYNHDDEVKSLQKTSLDYVDTYLKDENSDNNLQSDFKAYTEKETRACKMEIKENTLNEEINNLNDSHLGSCLESPIANSLSDSENVEIKENAKYKILKKERSKPKDGPVRKKVKRKKAGGLTPDETDMQTYFDVVKLTLQEQKEEWKRRAARRPLSSETVYECEVCSKIFAHINSYRIHLASHDAARGKVECQVCKLRFKNDVLAKSHANRAHAKKFYCKTCPKVFNNVGVAKKHQRWHSGYRYRCGWCSFSSLHESALGAHARRCHARAHTCAACARACLSRRGLRLHMATAHRDVEDTIVTEAYRCEACDINFVSEGARRIHLLTSSQHRKKSDLCDSSSLTSELRNTCSKCGIKCSSFSELVSHARAEHPRVNRKKWRAHDSYPTQCELCGETVTCRRNHWQHVRRQHPKETDTYRPVVTAICDTCGKGFQNSTKLHLHQLRHRAPTVRCDICPRLFYDKYALARHAITHKTNKPHQCRTCGRAFKLRSNLERHSRVHSDVTPYECTMCSKKFKYSSSVNLHIRTVHYKLPHPPRKKRNKTAKTSTSGNDL